MAAYTCFIIEVIHISKFLQSLPHKKCFQFGLTDSKASPEWPFAGSLTSMVTFLLFEQFPKVVPLLLAPQNYCSDKSDLLLLQNTPKQLAWRRKSMVYGSQVSNASCCWPGIIATFCYPGSGT